MDVFKNKHTKLFYDDLFRNMKPIFSDAKNDPIFVQNLWATFEGKGVSKRVSNEKQLQSWETFLWKLFTPFSEIIDSIDKVHMISIFIRQYPNYQSFKTNNITPGKYLRYHVENYLNEVYIFQQRVDSFLGIIEKTCQKKGINNNIKKIRKNVRKVTDSLVSVRGEHVHEKRFTEDSIDRISLCELLSNDQDMKEKLFVFNKLFYRLDRAKWGKDIAIYAKKLSFQLDYVLKDTHLLVFEEVKHKLEKTNKLVPATG